MTNMQVKKPWSNHPRGIWSRIKAALRVLAVLMSVQGIMLVWWMNQARAKGAEALEQIAAHLEEVPEMEPGSIHTVSINGARFKTMTARSPNDVSMVLDAAQAWCRERGGLEASEAWMRRLRQTSSVASPAGLLDALEGVLRVESDEQGVLLCLDAGGRLNLEELIAALQRFGETGDLGELGNLRYVRAQRTDEGSSALAVWTEGPLNLLQMFPAQGDAPGQDIRALPRAPETRRLLSAWELESEPWLGIYENAELGPAELLRFYARALPEAGWTLHEADAGARTDALTLTANRQDSFVILGFGERQAGGGVVTVSVL